jgi:hypothetical protein
LSIFALRRALFRRYPRGWGRSPWKHRSAAYAAPEFGLSAHPVRRSSALAMAMV